MNALSAIFTIVACGLLLTLPRRWAAIPLLLAVAYIGRDAVIQIGPANLTVLRILVVVGSLRVLAKGERLANGVNSVDRLLVLWAFVLLVTSFFHTTDAWVFRIGMIWNELGCYFLFRIFVQDSDDVVRIFKATTAILLPVAILMLYEKHAQVNLLSALGGYSDINIRDGHTRARGAFVHPILAGTVGAACLAMGLYLWKRYRAHGLIGLAAGAGIVYASTSSGPVMMVLFTLFGLALWKWRARLNVIRWFALFAIIGLDLIMKDPVYFLMARIDVTGSSTGWHRAQLIRASLEHLDEWWLAGTDYTRHWMPTGIHANEMHTDITNHLLGMGVLGGLPLVLTFILVLIAAFRAVGRALKEYENSSLELCFLSWTLGAMLFGQVMNFFSISLFDQSVIVLYLLFASIAAVSGGRSSQAVVVKEMALSHSRLNPY